MITYKRLRVSRVVLSTRSVLMSGAKLILVMKERGKERETNILQIDQYSHLFLLRMMQSKVPKGCHRF